MFTKILIVDDIDVINISTINELKPLNIAETVSAKYCDEALLKIKKAQQDNEPFQLLITDLFFKVDHRKDEIKSGEELIKKVKENYPNMKIIVFSNDEKHYHIKNLFEKYHINGYVPKSRESIFELKTIIQKVYNNEENNVPSRIAHILQDKTIKEIDHYDIQLLQQLALGVAQENMEAKFKSLGISPCSKSTIEKRIAKLKDYFQASNPVHLVAITKDLGII